MPEFDRVVAGELGSGFPEEPFLFRGGLSVGGLVHEHEPIREHWRLDVNLLRSLSLEPLYSSWMMCRWPPELACLTSLDSLYCFMRHIPWLNTSCKVIMTRTREELRSHCTFCGRLAGVCVTLRLSFQQDRCLYLCLLLCTIIVCRLRNR